MHDQHSLTQLDDSHSAAIRRQSFGGYSTTVIRRLFEDNSPNLQLDSTARFCRPDHLIIAIIIVAAGAAAVGVVVATADVIDIVIIIVVIIDDRNHPMLVTNTRYQHSLQ